MKEIICCLCGKAGGVFKQLPNGKYQHVTAMLCQERTKTRPKAKPGRRKDIEQALQGLFDKAEEAYR